MATMLKMKFVEVIAGPVNPRSSSERGAGCRLPRPLPGRCCENNESDERRERNPRLLRLIQERKW